MRSLSLEMNRALIAEVCERIIWSGGGAESSWGVVMVFIVKVKEFMSRQCYNDPGRRAGNQPT